MPQADAHAPALLSFSSLRTLLGLLLAWTLLDACLSLQFPAPGPTFGFLLPSPDVTVLLLGLCVLGHFRVRLPVAVPIVLSVLFVLVRLFRIADGVSKRHLLVEFRLFRDLALVPEFGRLVHSIYGPWGFVGLLLALLLAMGLLGWAVFWALRASERAVQAPLGRHAVLAVALAFLAVSPFLPRHARRDWRTGAFAQPTAPRVYAELATWLSVSSQRDTGRAAIAAAQAPLRARGFDLARLGKADVHLMFIESYGHVLLRMPRMRARMVPALQQFERAVGGTGFGMMSGLLTSPIYGGKSWLGHATMLTGTRVGDQMQFDLLLDSNATSFSKLFARAGYRAVLAAPAFERPFPAYFAFYGFDHVYMQTSFGYRGPEYAWAPMPDQYALEFVGKRELAATHGPLFLEYMLVSTHTPFTPQPRYVEDWEALGDGAMFAQQAPVSFGGEDPSVADLQAAYVSATEYDLRVIAAYLARHLSQRSLVILLGDHQPRADVTEADESWNVPVHVLSRDPALLEPFASRGFVTGALPDDRSAAPMESFLPWFMDTFSSPGARASIAPKTESAQAAR